MNIQKLLMVSIIAMPMSAGAIEVAGEKLVKTIGDRPRLIESIVVCPLFLLMPLSLQKKLLT